MNFQDEYLKKEQKNDICKKYCNNHKVIFFLCTYPVQISWGFTILVGLLFSLIFNFFTAGIFLFLIEIFSGLHELPWKINISKIINDEILLKYEIIENKPNYRFFAHLFFAFLYKILGNSILISIPWFIIGSFIQLLIDINI